MKTVFSTYRAFCALHNDKTVTVWGDKTCGGDDTKAKTLSNVAAIYTAKCAFAAVLENGNVVSWGTLESNKAITEPPGLSNVVQVWGNEGAFAALVVVRMDKKGSPQA